MGLAGGRVYHFTECNIMTKFVALLISFMFFLGDALFSPCSREEMKKRLQALLISECFKEISPDFQISICGNSIVEPGEECDCGPDIYHCNDPCCYPANIPLNEKLYYNKSAISCYVNESHYCLSSSPLVYGFYVPMAVILIVTIIIIFVLKQDWTKDKKLFRHITEGNIRVVTIRG